jgi:hypothetical protein
MTQEMLVPTLGLVTLLSVTAVAGYRLVRIRAKIKADRRRDG